MTEKLQFDELDNELSDRVKGISIKLTSLTLDEVQEIIKNDDSEKLKANFDNNRIENINMVVNQTDTLMMYSCTIGSIECFKFLLEHGALTEYIQPDDDEDEFDILLIAVIHQQIEVVNLLLNWYRESGLISQIESVNSLKHAAMHGYLDIIRSLVNSSPDQDDCIIGLYSAVCHNQIEVATYLLDRDVDFNAHFAIVRRMLNEASYEGNIDIVKLLLTHGIDINTVDKDVENPLKIAICGGHIDVAEILLEHGADPNLIHNDNSTILLTISNSTIYETINTFKLLLRYGADVSIAHTTSGRTPLITAAALSQRLDFVQLLLEHGADVTQVMNSGETVLDMLNTADSSTYGDAAIRAAITNLCMEYQDRQHILK